MRSSTCGRHRGRCFAAALAVAALSVSMSTPSGAQSPVVETYRPAPATGSHVVTWEGDPEFCPRLIRNAHRIEYVKPVLGPDDTGTIILDGANVAQLRLYFTQRKFPRREYYELKEAKDWMALLGYRPPAADVTPGRIVNEPGWREIDDKCPGIFESDYPRGGPATEGATVITVPTQLTRYRVDLNNDGIEDDIVRLEHHASQRSVSFFLGINKIDFDNCRLDSIIYANDVYYEIIRFQDKFYFEEMGSTIGADIYIYRADRKIKWGEQPLCSFERDGKRAPLGSLRNVDLIQQK